jgi:mRNA interferase MazF
LTAVDDNLPSDCVVNFNNIHTLPRGLFRRPVATLSARRMTEVCRTLCDAVGC